MYSKDKTTFSRSYLLMYLKMLLSGCFLQIFNWILTAKENAESYVTKLKVNGED